MERSDFLLMALLLTVLGTSMYILWLNLPTETVVYQPVQTTPLKPVSSSSVVQFYPSMRYRNSVITYFMDPQCSKARRQRILEAFAILSTRTPLVFYESNSSAELQVLCSEVRVDPSIEDHFVAGEGGPVEIINATRYHVIFAGKISLYRDDVCDKPNIALHEILHALGFDHTNSTGSIMYPVTNCDQTLDPSIIKALGDLYRDPSLPDVFLNEVQANKTGRYLSFSMNVSNYGLKDATDVILQISADGSFVQQFNLTSLPIGIRKTLSVHNLRVPSDTSQLFFNVSENEPDLDESNNHLSLTLG